MRIHSQNLNENPIGKAVGSMLWKGRAWLYGGKRRHDALVSAEWYFGKHATGFAATIRFGGGDCDSALCFHLCIPWLFSIYLTVPHVYKCVESQLGVSIHSTALWFYTFSNQNESRRDWPWWKQVHCWNFPWQWDWYSTELLNFNRERVWMESVGDRRTQRALGKDTFAAMREKEVFEKQVRKTFDYTYVLKNGKVQKREATIQVDRMTHRMRWHWILPFKKTSTCIWINFNNEVGEGTGSWKGGAVGCGYTLLDSETPEQCLRRMEAERKFGR